MYDTYRKTPNIIYSMLLGLFILSGCSGAGTQASVTESLSDGESTGVTAEATGSPVVDNTTGNSNPITEESSTSTAETVSATESGVVTITDSDTSTSTSTTDTDIDTNTNTNNNNNNTNGGLTDTSEAASNDDPAVVARPDAIPDNVRVNFDITVPAYQSNALQVRLVWGDLDTRAIWVADESWTITENLQSNSENLLVITFSDHNGDTILGSYEADLSVGVSSPIMLSIAETDFDTSWDGDNDGMSNLDELLLGRNPFQDDSFDNEQLRAMFPNRDTMFGEAIENIPNPDHFVNDELVSWRYDVVNGQLVHNDRVTPLSHTTVWERYMALTLPEHRITVRRFVFLAYTDNRDGGVVVSYNPTTTPGGTLSEPQFFEPTAAQIYTSEINNVAHPRSVSMSIMGMHASVLRGSQLIRWDYEYDVPTYSLQPGNRVLWDSWLREYYTTFWGSDVFESWNNLRDDPAALRAMFPGLFINNFAASGPSSDFTASFRLFVQMDSMPTADTFAGYEKVIWFWNQPEFVNIRSYARAAF